MLADFELNEIDRLNQIFDRLVQANQRERARMRTLIEMLHQLGVEVWTSPDGFTVVNHALEAHSFDWLWWSTGQPYPPALLGAGYMGLGADGT